MFAESELGVIGAQLVRAGYNLQRLGVTHTGALDVKDVVGYERLIFTTGANEALAGAPAEAAPAATAAPRKARAKKGESA